MNQKPNNKQIIASPFVLFFSIFIFMNIEFPLRKSKKQCKCKFYQTHHVAIVISDEKTHKNIANITGIHWFSAECLE